VHDPNYALALYDLSLAYLEWDQLNEPREVRRGAVLLIGERCPENIGLLGSSCDEKSNPKMKEKISLSSWL
jgi:hypothetical protein